MNRTPLALTAAIVLGMYLPRIAKASEQWVLVLGHDQPAIAIPMQTQELCEAAGLKMKASKRFQGKHTDFECLKSKQ